MKIPAPSIFLTMAIKPCLIGDLVGCDSSVSKRFLHYFAANRESVCLIILQAGVA